MYYVYVKKSIKDNKLYAGYTCDLRRRMTEHNSGQNTSTKGRAPFRLVYYEAYRSKLDAMHREKMLKLRANAFGQVKRRIAQSLRAD